MSALFLLIGISLVVATAFLIAFIWSVRKGQYEDEYTPAIRILLDDEPTSNPEKPDTQKINTTL
jgi:cbb3-type cytochrome oxidase maturation protein